MAFSLRRASDLFRCSPFLPCIRACSSGPYCSTVSSLPCWHWPVSVSYTHLEVYKRQLLNISNSKLGSLPAKMKRAFGQCCICVRSRAQRSYGLKKRSRNFLPRGFNWSIMALPKAYTNSRTEAVAKISIKKTL